ncbi:uncharacterized protein BDW47DRAFT_98102 [Aspergillus candidus]|uniref:Uncharacterized protein n=1 Tax=Aspergillus candidus TaxID=41067 RepID=A0A2I2FNM7_ASPCN|nr:hypothetical protein BDW47DRAFT_98102 [Aspergillus candidus]PLB42233.1 hypothetical protein BDW47DRAFT_98102 [Aspergillus candidus]
MVAIAVCGWKGFMEPLLSLHNTGAPIWHQSHASGHMTPNPNMATYKTGLLPVICSALIQYFVVRTWQEKEKKKSIKNIKLREVVGISRNKAIAT